MKAYLGLSWDGRHFADGLFPQRVDNGRLADVGVPDEADADGLLVLVEVVELAENLEQTSLAERILD